MQKKEGEAKQEAAIKNSVVSRRDFVRISAATTGAVTLPGNAVSQLSEEQCSKNHIPDLYRFVYEHTPDNETIPTLIKFSQESGVKAIKAHDIEVQTTTSPTPAAYADLTKQQVDVVLDISEVTTVRFSPGSNPWWLLDNYPRGRFPAPENSTGFISYRQMIDGLSDLEKQHPKRMEFYSIGSSPGWYNAFEEELDPKDLQFVEITNDVNNKQQFQEKEKVLYYLSMHGDERPGAEAGTRFIERLLTGHEPEIESLLDDIVLIFAYPNPDGWVARYPQYASDWVDDEPAPNTFTRQTGSAVDPNRQYPAVGWIDPEHYPADPDGTDLENDKPGIDDDVPDQYRQIAPGALSLVHHIRDYQNLTYAADLHGMGPSEDFMLSTFENGEFSYDELHDMNELHATIDQNLEALRPELEDSCGLFEELVEEIQAAEDLDETPPVPENIYSYGTEFDTIGYATSGASLSWMLGSEDFGGINVIGMTGEMAFSSGVTEQLQFRTDRLQLHVAGYLEYIRTVANHAAQNVTGTIETNGAKTAYVTTESLTRSSDNLPFVGTDEQSTPAVQTSETLDIGSEKNTTISISIPDDESYTLYTYLQLTTETRVKALLKQPSGKTVESFVLSRRTEPIKKWVTEEAKAGDWTLELRAADANRQSTVDVQMTVFPTAESPDPRVILDYEQREYEVTPFEFFDDYAAEISDESGESITPVTQDKVCSGELVQDGELCYDNLVVIHDDGIDTDEYVAALDEFVAQGGNLVLTDSAVQLLAVLDNNFTADIGSEDITGVDAPYYEAHFLTEKDLDHPLMDHVRPNQIELWKLPNLGYTPTDEARMMLVEPEALQAAGGTVVATTQEKASVGAIGDHGETSACSTGGSIQIIGSLLPPASQDHLHPFGLDDHSITLLGATILSNALGYQQHRYVNGDETHFPRPGDKQLLCSTSNTESGSK